MVMGSWLNARIIENLRDHPLTWSYARVTQDHFGRATVVAERLEAQGIKRGGTHC